MKQFRETLSALLVIILGCALVFQLGDMAMTIGGATILLYVINVFSDYYGRE